MATNLPSPVAERLRGLATAQESIAATCDGIAETSPWPEYHRGQAFGLRSAALQLRVLATQEDSR